MDMDIRKERDGSKLCIQVEGRLNATTASKLEEAIKGSLDNVENLIFDFENLEYISSAGLRIILSTQKIMNRQGKMIIKNVNEDVLEVFEITGFLDIITIE